MSLSSLEENLMQSGRYRISIVNGIAHIEERIGETWYLCRPETAAERVLLRTIELVISQRDDAAQRPITRR